MTIKLASDALGKTLHMGMPTAGAPMLFLAGSDKSLTKAERKDLLERSRGGEALTIEVEAVTYIQRDTPNRNAIRFKNTASALKKIAKSGKGSPVLIDHDQRSVMSRGGTVLSSSAEKVGDEWHFKQRLELVKPWAVEGVLDGTIDRFSIGWYPTGPILYSHNNEEVVGWPKHWPGDVLEDGTVVEWVYSSADLIEVSGVNVPAVTGTHIEGIKSALAAFEPQQRGQPKTKDKEMNGKILTLLGLSEAASDENAAEAVQALIDSKKQLSAELSAANVLATQAAEVVAEAAKAAKAASEAKLESDIASLYSEGKLMYGAAGVADPLEDELRSLHSVKVELFTSFAAKLSRKGPPVGIQSDSAPPKDSLGEYGPDRISRLRQSGMDPQRHAELAAKYDGSGRILIPGRA